MVRTSGCVANRYDQNMTLNLAISCESISVRIIGIEGPGRLKKKFRFCGLAPELLTKFPQNPLRLVAGLPYITQAPDLSLMFFRFS
jgi:hypothetical protein